MNFLQRLSVAGKLSFGFASVLVVMALITAFSIAQLGRLKSQAAQVAEVRLTGVRDALLMAESASRYRSLEFRLLLVPAERRKEVAALLADSAKQFEQNRAAYEGAIAAEDERALYAAAIAKYAEYETTAKQVHDKLDAGHADEAQALAAGLGADKFVALRDALMTLVKYNDEHATKDTKLGDAIYAEGRNLILGALLLGVVVASLQCWRLTRAVTRPLHQAVAVAKAVSEGDLTQRLEVTGRDELAQLTRALSDMSEKLRGVVTEVRSGVESVSTASAEIATGNQDLSSRTEQTASNLQETASSMEQLTSTVGQSADTARQANQLARAAAQAAERGGQVVEQVVGNMQQINESSRKIADIISVIDGIAFQTNILALNAAVEAARAGEQGRGFAVVAGEVRTLAQRSAQASREIKSLIHASVERVESGAQLVQNAGQSMDEIVASVGRMADMMGEITSAADEQRDGIGQVNSAVSNLDQMTQQNAALVEQSAAAASSLQEQARRLAVAVGVFRTAA
ncbi:methyl-accepting chemotaxis protein [Caldimonas brevitalea]|uniref:Methyl-accepting chemotaxis protein n=1 Tax=Caldimonas brevitalea TaxID=413882 RepID=A0A0G3BGD2_9BURK|nr:methyl-accepting chemotaxis protein [Caldimonas brevitalea]AKJ28367.1 methyl-accepting chemotaxis protein [Caldimonas brevitalea]